MNLFDIAKASSGSESFSSKRLTNNQLVNELVSHFRYQMKALSTHGSVLFPMSYTVFLEPGDFNALNASFPLIVDDIVEAFYDNINEYITPDSSLFTKLLGGIFGKQQGGATQQQRKIKAPSYEWSFILSQCDEPIPGLVEKVQRGCPICVSSLMSMKLNDGSIVSDSVQVSVSCQNSVPGENFNINYDSIRGVNIIGANHYRVKFNNALVHNNRSADSTPTANANSQPASETAHTEHTGAALATLEYQQGSKIYTYEMINNLISISGTSDTRQMRSIFHLPVGDLSADYVQIRHNPIDKKFEIASFGDETRVNGVPLPQSAGGNIMWRPLGNNSRVLMAGLYSVQFKIVQ